MKSGSKREIMYPHIVSTRVDWETKKEIETIAFFDRKKAATWIRDLIISAIRRYQRNPQYKRFKRDLEARINE